MRKVVAGLLTVLLIASCQFSSVEGHLEPGRFAVFRLMDDTSKEGRADKRYPHANLRYAPLEGVKQVEKDSGSESDIAFHLGDLRASKVFYFILRNVGEADITDISLSLGETGFSVSPSSISVLGPGDEFLPIVSIEVEHGLRLVGPGQAPTLPMGEATATLEVVGKTTDVDGREIEVSLTVDLTTRVLLVLFELWDGEARIDLSEYFYGSIVGEDFDNKAARFYEAADPTVKNVGNVPFDLYYYVHMDSSCQNVQAFFAGTVEPGDALRIPYSGDPACGILSGVKVDGLGVVSGLTEISMYEDGCIYFTVGPEFF